MEESIECLSREKSQKALAKLLPLSVTVAVIFADMSNSLYISSSSLARNS